MFRLAVYIHVTTYIRGPITILCHTMFICQYNFYNTSIIEYINSWIYENMVDENYSRFVKTGPNKGIYQPDEPVKQRKDRKEGKGARVRKKRLATVFSFYSMDFGDSL